MYIFKGSFYLCNEIGVYFAPVASLTDRRVGYILYVSEEVVCFFPLEEDQL